MRKNGKKNKKNEKKRKTKNKKLTKTPREQRRPRCPVLFPPFLPVVGPSGFRPSLLRASPSVCGPSRLWALPVAGCPGLGPPSVSGLPSCGPPRLWSIPFVATPVPCTPSSAFPVVAPSSYSPGVYLGLPFRRTPVASFRPPVVPFRRRFSAGARSVLDGRMAVARCVG